MPMKRSRLVPGIALSLAALALSSTPERGSAAGSAAAYKIGGRPWPGHVITYYNEAHDQQRAISRAVSDWNSSGVDVRFRPAPRAHAEVVIGWVPLHYPVVLGGEATIGYHPASAITFDPFPKIRLDAHGRPIGISVSPKVYHGGHMWIRHPSDDPAGNRGSVDWEEVAVHELGHVLGLAHETSTCAVMGPELRDPARCGPLKPWQRYCGTLTRDDIQGAIHLYGGVVRHAASGVCAKTTASAPAPPTSVQARLDVATVTISWTLPTPHPPLAGVIIKHAQDTCPTDPGNHQSLSGRPEGPLTEASPPTGRWCYSVWTVSTTLNASTTAAHAWLDIP